MQALILTDPLVFCLFIKRQWHRIGPEGQANKSTFSCYQGCGFLKKFHMDPDLDPTFLVRGSRSLILKT